MIQNLALILQHLSLNPIPDLLEQENAADIITHRIEQFSRLLGSDKQRIRDWCFVQAVLSACWAEQDKSEWLDYFIRFATIVKS